MIIKIYNLFSGNGPRKKISQSKYKIEENRGRRRKEQKILKNEKFIVQTLSIGMECEVQSSSRWLIRA